MTNQPLPCKACGADAEWVYFGESTVGEYMCGARCPKAWRDNGLHPDDTDDALTAWNEANKKEPNQ